MRWRRIRAKGWGRWARIPVLGLAAALAVFAGVHGLGDQERQQLRVQAAQQLAQSATAADSAPAASPSPAQSAAVSSAASGAPSSAFPSQTPSAASPAPTASSSGVKLAGATLQPSALPPRHFAWPAAGLSVNIVPIPWSATQVVDPPLDSDGFDPVGHWLVGTGESAAVRPVVLAGHTCHQQVALCTDATFPFNRLSYAGWALGQPASLTEANGGVAACALADRKIVDKSKAFSFANDPCQVVLFSCNYDNPDAQIVLLTFRCGQCT